MAALFRAVADGETGHAFGHLGFLEQSGDPITGVPVSSTIGNVRSAIDGEVRSGDELYRGFARTACEEGFEEIADWFAIPLAPRGPTPRGSSRCRPR